MQRLCVLLVLALWLSGCTTAGWQFAAAPEIASTPQSASTGGMEAAASAGAPAALAASLPPETREPTLDPAAGQQAAPPVPQAPTAAPRSTATPAPYIQGSRYFSPGTNPLTGLKVDNPTLLERRPIVVKVTNFPRGVRPQWGLSRADHVYEYYIGDAMSRFIGVFYGQDAEQVGPIRSARLFDEHVMRTYQGIFVFGWADDPVLEPLLTPDLKNHLVVEHGNNCPPLCRIGPSKTYNNLYTDTSAIAAYLEERGTDNNRPVLTGLRFEQETPPSGSPGSRFSIKYSNVSYHYWQYDPDTGRYLRYQETGDQKDNQLSYAALTDSLTGEQLAAGNVLVLLLPHTYYLKSSSTEILDQVFTGNGQGYAFRDGQIFPIQWSHSDPNRLPSFELPNGHAYPLKPGTVWIEILSRETVFSPAEGSGWSFDFSLPEPPPTATPTPAPTSVKAGSRAP
jgi:hypothetical protein